MDRIAYYYHWLMANYYGWRLHRIITKMKKMGKKHGLPSLDAYTDEQIVEGFRRHLNAK